MTTAAPRTESEPTPKRRYRTREELIAAYGPGHADEDAAIARAEVR